MPPEHQDIKKEDLYLLLDSYKNSVELSTVIMELLRQISDSQLQISQTINELVEKQKEIIQCLSKITISVKTCTDDINASNEKFLGQLNGFDKHLSVFETEQKGLFGKVSGKINLVYVGLGTLITSLLGIIYLLVEKLHILSEILEKMGVQ